MELHFQMNGLTFAVKDDERVKSLRPEWVVDVVPEPDNKFDPLALRVEFNGVKMGYIPSINDTRHPEIQGMIHDLIKHDLMWSVRVVEYRYVDGDDWNGEHRGQLGSVTLALEYDDDEVASLEQPEEKPPPADGGVTLKSFNEDLSVLFDEREHRYFYGDEEWTSVTRLLKSIYPEFNAAMIAMRCADKWQMQAGDIERLWRLGGDAAAAVGTGIHAYLEAYTLYGERALPRMGFLRDIILTCPLNDVPQVGAEALITDKANRVCGLSDRLEQHGSAIRVSDYKVNYGVTERKSNLKVKAMPDLEPTKLSKFRLQLSCYGDMIERAGLTVDDTVTAYVYDGAWVKYDLERIPCAVSKVLDAGK